MSGTGVPDLHTTHGSGCSIRFSRAACVPARALCYNSAMDKSLHNVSDLPQADRSAVEAIVGHPLQNDDVLYIAMIIKGVRTH